MQSISIDPHQHACDRSAWKPLDATAVESSIGERFLRQSTVHYDCLAIGDGPQRVTYGQLEQWSGSIASALIGTGLKPGGRAVLMLEQGATSIVATLGTLRAGLVYVPLDRDEPDGRLGALLDRLRPGVVLTDDVGAARIGRLAGDHPVVVPDAVKNNEHRILPYVGPGSPASIHFTSGSTGQPKGVMDCHRNIVHNSMRYSVALDIGPADRLSLVQPPASSATMSSMFAALLGGAAVFPYRLDAGSLGALAAWLRTERVTIYHSVPAILRRALAFADDLPDIRTVRLEGDRAYGVDMGTWCRHFRPGTRIANGFGTTETGLCRQFIVDVEDELPDGIMPVGYAVTDMLIGVVDEKGEPLEAGAVGEIAVTSEYLATGYWDDDRLTAEVFSPVAGRSGARTYRTGDLGRLRPDGCLEYLGRSDGLAKVLGHRVEPAEVEAALAAIPGVRAVAVNIFSDGAAEGRVHAYVVTGTGLDEPALRAGADSRLPAHMRPSRYMVLAELPIAANGKVDRAALPEMAASDAALPLEDPVSLEGRIMEVVTTVLGRPIGPDDDFFLAGGDSLQAVDVLLGLERLSGRRLPPSLVLQDPTVSQLADRLAAAPADKEPGLYQLSGTAAGPPVVLVPSHYGHALAYATLARRLAGARTVFASDVVIADDVPLGERSFESIARRLVADIEAFGLEGPFLLGGFCFGGALAYEMARQLVAVDRKPAGLYLLGVSPFDFPGLVPPEARERWDRSMMPLGKLGRIVRAAVAMTEREGRRYASDRLERRGRLLWGLVSREGRARRRSRKHRSSLLRSGVGHYRGPALALPVTVILPSWSLAAYWEDPVGLWAGIGSVVDVQIVPGVERMMLAEPVVSSVAAIMTRDPGANGSGT